MVDLDKDKKEGDVNGGRRSYSGLGCRPGSRYLPVWSMSDGTSEPPESDLRTSGVVRGVSPSTEGRRIP